MEYTIRVQREENGWYSGQCEQVPEAISQAPTLNELKANIAECIKMIFQFRQEELRKQYKGTKSVRELLTGKKLTIKDGKVKMILPATYWRVLEFSK